MTNPSAQERVRATAAKVVEDMGRNIGGDKVFMPDTWRRRIAAALTETYRRGAEAGWMAASAALGYEARKESVKADLASGWWAAAVWLDQHRRLSSTARPPLPGEDK